MPAQLCFDGRGDLRLRLAPHSILLRAANRWVIDKGCWQQLLIPIRWWRMYLVLISSGFGQ